MTQAFFKGQVTKVDCQTKVTKLTIEVDTEKTKLDEIKELLDTDVDIHISDNQATLTVKYPISEDKNPEKTITVTAVGPKRLEGTKEALEQ